MIERPQGAKDWWIVVDSDGEMREMDREECTGCRDVEC